jgi:tRNA isopentenyl-2-thiomethyl-A-37 hydroxylase MiaE
VIYFDPANPDRPMGLNMLEYDKEFPELKTLVINEMLEIFNKLFDMKTSGGAGFEAMFRNATQLVMEHPASGNTLLEISRVLSDKDFRDYKLSKCKNPMIHQYWKNAEATTGEQGLSNWVPFINSKIDPFLTNDIMRPIVCQEESSFNIREIMDKKKILLVNLSKGRLGETNSNLLGLILIGKFAQAALARANSIDRPDFYLYLDEFQNVVTPSISSILSEARKYRLSLNIAHQFLGQLPEDIKNAVFGNVGNMLISRVGPDDAQFLEKQFAPVFTSSDIMKIENLNSYAKILSKGTPQKPFSIHVPYNDRGDVEVAEQLKELSFLKYGRKKQDVEEEIMSKYQA